MAVFPSPQSFLTSLGGSAEAYALNFNGVDNYLEIGDGSVPASMQFQPSDSWTVAAWIKCHPDPSNPGGGRFSRIGGCDGSSVGWSVYWQTYSSTTKLHGIVRSSAASADTVSFETPSNYAFMPWTVVNRDYHCIIWTSVAGVLRSYVGETSWGGPSAAPTFTSISYSGKLARWFTQTPTDPTQNTHLGEIAQVGVWSSDQTANIADIHAGGEFIDWATLAAPPDVVHYRIGSDDDPSSPGGIIDRSGNGLHATLVNGSADDLVSVKPG